MIPLDKLDHMQNPDPHWAFTSPAAKIASTILTFAVGLCIWKVCSRSKDPATPAPSALPMPLQVIVPQPATAPAPTPATAQRPAPINQAMKNNTTVPINIMFT